jgi:hypothetical protein
MRWFRSKLHLGSRLALVALALQMILSFGHVHGGDLAPASTKSAMLTGSGAHLLSARAPSHDPDVSLETDCPICALIQLVASSAPPVAPALPLPASLGSLGLPAAAEMALASLPQFSFQARAPPLA